MPVIIGGNEIRPAPYVSLATSYQTLGDGRWVGSTITANLKGTIVATKTADVETPLAIEQRLSSIIHKQKEIRDLFASKGQWFEVQGLDGSQAVRFICIVDDIQFEEGPWVETCGWTVTLHGETPAGEEGVENNHIESASESWQFQEGDGPHVYSVTHNLSAKGKVTYDPNGTIVTNAWEFAKNFVTNKLALGWTAVGGVWSNKSGNDIFTNGNMLPEFTFNAFNRVVSEQVDEADGTYNVTENFTLSVNNYWEEYTVSVRKETGNPLVTTTATISGVIHGLTDKLHDPEGRTAAALARWTTTNTLLLSRIVAYSPGVTFNTKHTVHSFDVNYNEGTVSYNCEFDDRVLINNTYEWYNVSLETGEEDNKTTVRIDGSITGVRYYDDAYNPQLPFDRAWLQFQNVKLLMFQRAQADSGITDLKAFPVSASVTPDRQGGSVSYSFAYDNRIPELVRDEFTVSIRSSRVDGRTIIGVNGTITGLRSASASYPFVANNQFERYNNALSYFTAMEPGIIGLAGKYVDVSKVNPLAFSKSVSHAANAGQVSYEYEFNSIPKPCVSGALSENVTIMDDAATQVIAIIPVLGRTQGPVIQDIGTVKEKRRTVTIEIVMPTDVNTSACSASAPTFNVPVTPYAPVGTSVYIEQDQTQWSPSSGHYSRTVSWIYE